jgi:SiaC family regulatory phosphoprotein
MNAIRIEAKEDTPEVIIDHTAARLSISGRSLPEDVANFYKPVLDWLSAAKENPLSGLVIEVKLEYFNTASSKILLDIFLMAEDFMPDSQIVWHYDSEDDDMKEAGEEYQELVSIQFDLLAY